jgi:large subunit ribosomal protein L9
MKIILLKDVENLGEEGQIVNVKNGYGRNFLIPKGLARLATAGTVKAWEEERRQSARKHAKKKEDAERLAREIEAIEIVLTAKVGEENRIFGSITAQNIAASLAGHGIVLDRRQITLDDDIRVTGIYSATVKIHSEVSCQVKVRVEAEGVVADAG